MLGRLRQPSIAVLGGALAVLLAGSANAQTFHYSTSASPTSCAGTGGNGATAGSLNITDTGPNGTSAGCSANGTDIVLANLTVSSTSTTPETISGCNETLTLTLTDPATGTSGNVVFTGSFGGTFSSTTANVTFNRTGPTLPDTITVGCTQFSVTTFSYVAPNPPGSFLLGAFGAHVTCTPVCLPPTITCPTDKTVECGGDTSPTGTGTPTTSDPCGNTVTLDHTDSFAAACGNTGTITRTWTATNSCGQTNTCVQHITVVDTTPPTIGTPGANATIQCPNTPSFTPPTASDTCGTATVNLISDVTTPTPGACDPTTNFSETRTWDATDACGNHSGQVSQTITVQCPCNVGCTFTQGYYKTHESVTCGLIGAGIVVGGKTYTCSEVLAIYNTPVRGNGAISLFHQLVTAKLNALGIAGQGGQVPSAVQTCIQQGDALLAPIAKLPAGSLSPSATSAVTNCLDNFNNGLAGIPHCPG